MKTFFYENGRNAIFPWRNENNLDLYKKVQLNTVSKKLLLPRNRKIIWNCIEHFIKRLNIYGLNEIN